MSFSSHVKSDLCRIETNDKCCLFAELSAVVRVSGVVRMAENGSASIKIITENAAFARRFFSIIKKLYNLYPEVITRRSNKLKKHISYILVLTGTKGLINVLERMGIVYDRSGVFRYQRLGKRLTQKSCCKKAYLRGAFLAGGSVSDPEKTYHLEIAAHEDLLSDELCTMINEFGLHAKVISRKGGFVSYLKEGENIVDFLNIIGAHSALLELENVRILKEMRNNVNRIVNCETANLEKTVKASVRQVENISYIKEKIGFEQLPDNLREIAELRLDYSEANLKELGEMLTPALGKSGVNHRLRKLDQIAEDLRGMKGE